MAPIDSRPVEVWPGGEIVDGHMFRGWLRGQAWIRPDDADYFPAEVDADEWVERQETSVRAVFHSTRELINALEEAIDPDSEVAAAVRDRMAAANAQLDAFYRVMAERVAARPVSRQRVRGAA